MPVFKQDGKMQDLLNSFDLFAKSIYKDIIQKSSLRLLSSSSYWLNCSFIRFFIIILFKVMSLLVSIFLLISFALMNY